MKIIHEEVLIDAGSFSHTQEFQTLHQQIHTSISKVVWPLQSDSFVIQPGNHVNGVVPIKRECMNYLHSLGWGLEVPLNLQATINRPGELDASIPVRNSNYAIEWETGNISSSHRAINKMVLGLIGRGLLGGTLIIPSRLLYPHLTDRIGNYEELEPYFPVWKSVNVVEGFISIISVEYDGLDISSPLIPKGTDGRALR